jgi:hypothetical protein
MMMFVILKVKSLMMNIINVQSVSGRPNQPHREQR